MDMSATLSNEYRITKVDVPKLVAEVERLRRKLAYVCGKDVPYMIRNFGEESYYEWCDNLRKEALECAQLNG